MAGWEKSKTEIDPIDPIDCVDRMDYVGRAWPDFHSTSGPGCRITGDMNPLGLLRNPGWSLWLATLCLTPSGAWVNGAETLDRGVVAVAKEGGGVFVSWSSLTTDPVGLKFDVLRAAPGENGFTRVNPRPLTNGCNFVDATAGTNGWQYQVRANSGSLYRRKARVRR